MGWAGHVGLAQLAGTQAPLRLPEISLLLRPA